MEIFNFQCWNWDLYEWEGADLRMLCSFISNNWTKNSLDLISKINQKKIFEVATYTHGWNNERQLRNQVLMLKYSLVKIGLSFIHEVTQPPGLCFILIIFFRVSYSILNELCSGGVEWNVSSSLFHSRILDTIFVSHPTTSESCFSHVLPFSVVFSPIKVIMREPKEFQTIPSRLEF